MTSGMRSVLSAGAAVLTLARATAHSFKPAFGAPPRLAFRPNRHGRLEFVSPNDTREVVNERMGFAVSRASSCSLYRSGCLAGFHLAAGRRKCRSRPLWLACEKQ